MLSKRPLTAMANFRSHRRQRRLRSAIMLLELVGLMSIAASIMALSAVVMHKAFTAHSTALQHLRQTEQLQQLVHRWRQDVHAAVQVELIEIDALESETQEGDGPNNEGPNNEGQEVDGAAYLLKLTDATASKQITYRRNLAGLLRELRHDDQLIGSEQWSVPESARILFRIDTRGRRTLVAARLEFPLESSVPTTEWLACVDQASLNDEDASAVEVSSE